MVAIGRALVADPKIILVDELSAGLAPVIAQQLVSRLALVKETGIALLLVEQAPALILDDVDHVVVLRRGRAVHSGPAAELNRDHLRHLYLGRSAHHLDGKAS
jgi:branched-chain amino acid transport system ATP-binding protein